MHKPMTTPSARPYPLAASTGRALASACQPCVRHDTLLLSIATNVEYLAQVADMAESAVRVGYNCVCAAASSAIGDHHMRLHNQSALRLLHLPLSSTWRPPSMWCAQKLSGWRHAGILKMHALATAQDLGWNLLLIDADWRLVADPLPALLGARRDVISARDQTRHMLNVGAMLVRATPELRQISRRILNRTLGAWDQAIFTEEVGASSPATSCCWAHLSAKPYIAHAAVSRTTKNNVRSRNQECRRTTQDDFGGSRLAPPAQTATSSTKRMYPRWHRNGYNHMDRAFYRFKCYECDAKCTKERCELASV